MSLFAKLFNKNTGEVSSKNVEDFVSLTRVYFQSVIAANLGITNIRFVPDVANFKRLFKIPTQGGRLGQAEKAASRKMLTTASVKTSSRKLILPSRSTAVRRTTYKVISLCIKASPMT